MPFVDISVSKTVGIVVLSILFGAGTASGQSLEIGFQGGGNYTSFTGDTDAFDRRISSGEYTSQLGGRTGPFFRISTGGSFSFRMEVAYSRKGAKLELLQAGRTRSGGTVRVESDLRFDYDYLSVPVLAEYQFRTEKRLRSRLFIGPSIGFALGSSIDSNTEAKVFDRTGSERSIDVGPADFNEPDLETVEVGAIVGAEVSYQLASGNSIFIDARYNRSFTNHGGEEIVDFGEEDVPDLKNEVFSVGVGYTFDFR